MAGSRRDVRAGGAYVEVGARTAALDKGLRRAEARLNQFAGRTQALGRSMLALGIAAGAPLAMSAKTVATFDDAMSAVQAKLQASEGDFERLRQKALALGSSTSYSATEAAGAMNELAMAGFSVEEILQTVPGLLDIARGTATDLGEAAGITANILRGFRKPASEVGSVLDVLAKTATSSSTDLTLIGESMKYVAPLAAGAGEDIEDVAAAVGILANNGIKGSQAGTALARAYKNISKEPVQAKLREAGVEAVDAQNNMRKLRDILVDLSAATAEMGSAQRLGILDKLFGRGAVGVSALSAGRDELDALARQIRNADGAARRMAVTMDDNLGGSTRRMLSAAEGLRIALGDHLKPELRALADATQEYLAGATTWTRKNRETVIAVGKATVAVAGFGATLIAVGTAARGAALALGAARTLGLASAASAALGPVARLNTTLKALHAMNVAQGLKWIVHSVRAFAAAKFAAGVASLGTLGTTLKGLTTLSGVKAALGGLVSTAAVGLGPVLALAAAFGALAFAVYKGWKWWRDHNYIKEVREETRRTLEETRAAQKKLLEEIRGQGRGANFTLADARGEVKDLVDEMIRAGATAAEVREQLRGHAGATATWKDLEWSEGSAYSKDFFTDRKHEMLQWNKAYEAFLDRDLKAMVRHRRAMRRETEKPAPAQPKAGAGVPDPDLPTLDTTAGLNQDFDERTRKMMADITRQAKRSREELMAQVNLQVGASGRAAAGRVPTPDEAGVPSLRVPEGKSAAAQMLAGTNSLLGEIRDILDERLALGLA